MLAHWNKLGQLRNQHVAVEAGRHQLIAQSPYTFTRTYRQQGLEDRVVITLDALVGEKQVAVGDIFAEGVSLTDAYSGQ